MNYSKKNNNGKKNNGNGRYTNEQMRRFYGTAHHITRWMGRGDNYQIDYVNNDEYYPNVIHVDDYYTKSAIDLGEEIPDMVVFISHDRWLSKRNKMAMPKEVEQIEVNFDEDEISSRPEAFRRTIDLVEKAATDLNERFPQGDFLRQPSKDAKKPKVLVFADFPLLAAQVLVDSCPQIDCYYADNIFYPKGKLGIRMCVAAYESSQKISAQHDGWMRMGARLLKKPRVEKDLLNF